MIPDLGLKYEARAYDDLDSQLASAFRTGELTYDLYIKHPKYVLEGILSVIILPNSVCQIGHIWTRYVPFIVRSKIAPKSIDNLTLLSIKCFLNQAVQMSASLKSNDIIDVLKPDVLSSSITSASVISNVDTVEPPDSSTEAVLKPSLKIDMYTDPTGFVPRPFDFNAAVATYIDFLEEYPNESLPPAKKPKLIRGSNPAPPAIDRVRKREARRYPVGYKEPLPSSSDGFWDDFLSNVPIAHRELFVSTALEIFIAYRSLSIPLDRSLDFTKTPIELTRERLEFLQTVADDDFNSMPDKAKVLCNLSLWTIGSRIPKLAEPYLSRIISDFAIDESIMNRFHQAFRVGRVFSSLWNSDIPIDRIGNIKSDLNKNLTQLGSSSHTALYNALHALKNRW